MTTLIICEKPSAALRIATALADKKPKKQTNNKIAYYELEHNGQNIVVCCAVGHLYTVTEKDKKGWTYPTFKTEWKASFEVNKHAAFTKPYVNTIKKLAKNADNFIVATDFDIEGEVIGYNIVHFICKKEDAKRMKFSTLTKEELISSYENALPTLEWGQVKAGLTRHELDFFYGINLSRALTLSIKNAKGMFKILSSGRVQGPALKILADREREIKAFKPVPFWQIELLTENGITALHKENKFWDKKKADDVMKKTKGKDASVVNVDKHEFEQKPPAPFDLTALQLEAYKTLGISPKETLALTQNLYIESYISYPRTSSNQLPPSIDLKKILTKLSKQKAYKELCEELLNKQELKPHNGAKVDPAHPACHPTGEFPAKIKGREKQLYDLIVRRTLATLSEPALRETVTVELDVNGELFLTKGTTTKKQGWHKFYGKFAMMKEEELPPVAEGENLKVKELNMHDKETQPPKRYTPASIIKELEKRSLGTKATRAHIVDSLYHRDYIVERSIEVTDLGLKTVQVLENYCPEILDEHLTREIEEEMEEIREKKTKSESVLKHAQDVLTKVLEHFKENEQKIGEGLAEAHIETRDKESIVGKCPKCKKGDLRILYSKRFKSYFVACSGYPKCKTTFSLTSGKPKPSKKECPSCGFQLITIIRAGKRPFDYCFNRECPKRLEWIEQQKKKQKEDKKKTN